MMANRKTSLNLGDGIEFKIGDLIDEHSERLKARLVKQVEKLTAHIDKLERAADVPLAERLLHLSDDEFADVLSGGDGGEIEARVLDFRGLPSPRRLVRLLDPENMECEVESAIHVNSHPVDFKGEIDRLCEFATRLDVYIDKLGEEYEGIAREYDEKHPGWREANP